MTTYRDAIDLDHLGALTAAATPGPWIPMLAHDSGYVVGGSNGDSVAHYVSSADTDAIVAMRNALPALVAAARERDRLRNAVLALADAIEDWGHRFGIAAAKDSADNDLSAFAAHEDASNVLREQADRLRAVVTDTTYGA